MSSALAPVIFSADLLPLVERFECGLESWEQEVADWIRTDAVTAVSQGTKAWLYATDDCEIVGFGSVGVTRWHYPDPSSKRVEVAVIPAVAVRTPYRGQPPGPPEERYSSQILDHLILEAAALPISVPILGLFVHPANTRAIKAYERARFGPFSQTYTDKATGVTYRSMIRALAPPSG